ncbi:MAG: DUF2273 domain-containing protein [Christensenellales bacterium]
MNESWKVFFKKNKGKIIGATIGIITGILILTINFWRTLLLAICLFVGFFLGWRSDRNKSFLDLLDKWLSKLK